MYFTMEKTATHVEISVIAFKDHILFHTDHTRFFGTTLV